MPKDEIQYTIELKKNMLTKHMTNVPIDKPLITVINVDILPFEKYPIKDITKNVPAVIKNA